MKRVCENCVKLHTDACPYGAGVVYLRSCEDFLSEEDSDSEEITLTIENLGTITARVEVILRIAVMAKDITESLKRNGMETISKHYEKIWSSIMKELAKEKRRKVVSKQSQDIIEKLTAEGKEND